MQIPHPDVAKILTNNLFEWIVLDLEHGSGSINDVSKLNYVIGDSKISLYYENFRGKLSKCRTIFRFRS